MGQTFEIPSYPDQNLLDDTVLTENADSGQKVIDVIGTDDFEVGDYGVLGVVGSLFGEIHQIDSLDTDSITFEEDLIQDHRKTEPFQKLFGNQINCYRADNVNNYPPDDGDFALLSTTDIDADSPITYITDEDGGAGFWYKFTYFNEETDAETLLSEATAIRGGDFGHYVDIPQIKAEAGLSDNNQIQDTQVATRRDQAESEIDGALLASDYILPLQDQKGKLYTPPIITNIARLLAAGYVLTQDYGPVSDQTTKDGESKLKQGRKLLSSIQDHTYILVDINKRLMATKTRVRGFPDDNTATSGTNGVPEPPFFRASQKF